MHIIKLKECVMRINKRAQIFFYFLSHFLLTISRCVKNAQKNLQLTRKIV